MVKGRDVHFEFSQMFGPAVVDWKTRDPLEEQPIHEDHPFWAPFNRWLAMHECRQPLREG